MRKFKKRKLTKFYISKKVVTRKCTVKIIKANSAKSISPVLQSSTLIIIL